MKKKLQVARCKSDIDSLSLKEVCDGGRSFTGFGKSLIL